MIFFVQNFYAVINCYFKQTQLDSVCKSYTDDEDVGHTGRFPRIPWVRLWTHRWEYYG